MEYPKEQIDQLRPYCTRIGALNEGGVTFFYLEGLQLPAGCVPNTCDGLLCPVEREGYPSRLYLSVKVTCPYERDWKVSDARIGEKNWFVFSWKVDAPGAPLVHLLVAHLNGFAKTK